MFSFTEIVGHEQIKEHMQAAIRDKKPFHAYLFQGEEGVGKEALARTFAAGLQCQSESADKPCKECVSCRQMESGNQPDVIWVTREKASLGVDEIREQLCNTMDIKPFSSPYKIYLVPEAEKMTEAAQNALLKTIEEPPEYGIVILMTTFLRCCRRFSRAVLRWSFVRSALPLWNRMSKNIVRCRIIRRERVRHLHREIWGKRCDMPNRKISLREKTILFLCCGMWSRWICLRC